jgi:endonuclease/exonuclease/phosphatase family metal-dependent hydrolase
MLVAMRARSALCLLAPLVLTIGCGGDDGGTPMTGPGLPVKVMTRNLYLGADLIPVVTATTVDEIPMRVAELWRTMQASDPPARIKLLADEIAAAKPDLVGLQEAVVFYKQTPSDFSFANPAINADHVELDFVQLLLAELMARGLTYTVAVSGNHTDVELPAADPVAPFDVRMTDRDVILARMGVTTSNPQAALFPSHLKFDIPFGSATGAPVDLVRGVTRVDAVVDGAHLTFVNTHLEVGGGGDNPQAKALLGPLQENQAKDLLAALAPVSGPVVLVGDFNSAANGSTTMSYGIVAAKFTDAQAAVSAGTPGFTCCTDFTAPAAMAGQRIDSERIDIVFYRGGVSAQAVEVVGVDPAKRTATGLWPSDHAGVVASLQAPGTASTSTGGSGGKKY